MLTGKIFLGLQIVVTLGQLFGQFGGILYSNLDWQMRQNFSSIFRPQKNKFPQENSFFSNKYKTPYLCTQINMLKYHGQLVYVNLLL